MGIFITGPMAFLVGLGLEWIYLRLRVPRLIREVLFVMSIAGIAAGTLLLSQPGDQHFGSLVDGEMVACQSVAARLPWAVETWQRVFKSNPQLKQRPGWQEEMKSAAAHRPGVVIELRILRTKEVCERIRGYEPTTLVADSWVQQHYNDSFFADYSGGDCKRYQAGGRHLFWSGKNRSSGEDPPGDLPSFLQLGALEPIPKEIQQFMR